MNHNMHVGIRGQLSRICSLPCVGLGDGTQVRRFCRVYFCLLTPSVDLELSLFKSVSLMCVSLCLCVHLRTISCQARSMAGSLVKCVTLWSPTFPKHSSIRSLRQLESRWKDTPVLVLAFTGAPFNPSTWERGREV